MKLEHPDDKTGKSARPKRFNKIRSLPVTYVSSNKSWMTLDILQIKLVNEMTNFVNKRQKCCY